MEYVPRLLAKQLEEYLDIFPIVLIWGPRQCGKSTFVAHELPHFEHFDLERPADFTLISNDLELFFTDHADYVCIDEAQRLPELFSALRYIVDERRKNGRFVLLGSSGPILLNRVSETLAGRIGILELSPFANAELLGRFSWRTRWWRGGLPPLYNMASDAQRVTWLTSYMQTIVERDLPNLGIRVPARRLFGFWSMLATVHGQLLNISMLARSLGTSASAVTNYLDILESALLIRRLKPFFANIKKRLVKSPKVFIRDTGILHRLAGLTEEKAMEFWGYRGASFEGLVVEELTTAALRDLVGPEFYFYRTQAGAEVDLLVKSGVKIWPVEIKLGIEVNQYDTAGLRHCMEDLGIKRGFIVARSRENRAIGRGMHVLSWEQVASGTVYPWTYAG